MNEFRFASQNWLYAAWAVVACCGLLITLELRGRSLLDRMLTPWMQRRLVHKTPLSQRLVAIALLGLALLAGVLAMMRPQWGMTLQSLARVESQVMICLDVSKSMLAEDVVPNRLERAKAEIDALLALMEEGQQVGLMAFAGKATVVSPMTTDFGFLRLVLSDVSPATAGLGGTKIGDAIRKAVDGFREVGDVNRLILLITDGEDHDSFPLDAAEQAMEKGIRIVSIGFGDEAGSKIEITDPQTGARSFVKDSSGQDVVSRLDGETLREIALTTQGAYIPAGTGALDLQSIYEAHIRSMLAGSNTEEQRIIRNEGYQWFVMLSLILLILSLIVRTSFPRRSLSTMAAALILLMCTPSQLLLAQSSADDLDQPGGTQAIELANPSSGEQDENSVGDAIAESELPESVESNLPPRLVYNRAVSLIRSDPDQAERLLTQARNRADVDGELRFSAIYNLGWVDVQRAEPLMESQPEEALKYLELAAGRFREAIRLRPESQDARHNLEVLSRRILELRDAIAKREQGSLEQQLDKLITLVREQLLQLQSMTELVSGKESELPELRSNFRRLGLEQRRVMAVAEDVTTKALQELEQLQAESSASDAESAETQLRTAQLNSLMNYLNRGVQRMAKARSFTRRSQADRAFLRWSSALSDLKRGRDQLRNPIEVLGVLINEASQLALQTQQLASDVNRAEGQPGQTDERSSDSNLNSELDANLNSSPAWLTVEYLLESQQAVAERVSELTQTLAAAIPPEQSGSGSEGDSQESVGQPSELGNVNAESRTLSAEELLQENIRSALPFLRDADENFAMAVEGLTDEDIRLAIQRQASGRQALIDAAEFFYDLRRLVEIIYEDERIVQAIVEQQLDASETNPQASMPSDNAVATELIELARAKQSKNQARLSRLDQLLDLELSQLMSRSQADSEAAAPLTAASQAADPQQLDAEQLEMEQQRLQVAKELVVLLSQDMNSILQALTESEPGSDAPTTSTETDASSEDDSIRGDESVEELEEADASEPAAEGATKAESDDGESDSEVDEATTVGKIPVDKVNRAISNLEELRRLFFTLIEHLRDTARQQAELTDDATELAGTQGRFSTQHDGEMWGPIEQRQSELRKRTQLLADALREQGQQAESSETANNSAGVTDPQAVQRNSQAAEKLTRASELVDEGGELMQQAAEEAGRLTTAETSAVQTAPMDENSPKATEPKQPDEQEANSDTQVTDSESAETDSSQRENADERESSTSTSGSQQTDVTDSEASELTQLQREALEKLLQALQLLDDQQDNSQQDQQQQDQQQSQQNESSGEQQESTEMSSENLNAAQMLQAIRDREAQRRREKQNANSASRGVDKDW